jgi:hypothetical protein
LQNENKFSRKWENENFRLNARFVTEFVVVAEFGLVTEFGFVKEFGLVTEFGFVTIFDSNFYWIKNTIYSSPSYFFI